MVRIKSVFNSLLRHQEVTLSELILSLDFNTKRYQFQIEVGTFLIEENISKYIKLIEIYIPIIIKKIISLEYVVM